ncbi:MAG: hypothetical protein RLZZ262_2226 [Bacteroidota bacterium]|jgi:5'-deoxynucleotidase YfbR-like HD superfamily hydrolase
MTIEQIREKILSDDEFVLSEVARLQYLYRLKTIIRYADNRTEQDATESVAEHVFGMHILAQYFLALEENCKNFDKTKIFELITLHDIDEIETGDVIGYLKTNQMRDEESSAMRRVIKHAPLHLQERMSDLVEDYDKQESEESRYVKAIDRFEPQIHLFNEKGKGILRKHRTTREQNMSLREEKLKPYPYMYHMYRVIEKEMFANGYFSDN